MGDYLIEYVLTQVREVRVIARTKEDAIQEVKNWHHQLDRNEKISETVIITHAEVD